MQSLIRSKSAGVTGGRGTAGAGPGRDLLYYGTTASALWLELRGPAAWQATPSWTVYRLACHRWLPWLRVTFAMVPDAAWLG